MDKNTHAMIRFAEMIKFATDIEDYWQSLTRAGREIDVDEFQGDVSLFAGAKVDVLRFLGRIQRQIAAIEKEHEKLEGER